MRSRSRSIDSRGSLSDHSETSCGSDHRFGSDVYNADDLRIDVNPFSSRIGCEENSRGTTMPVLQKSAMSAFIASPSSSRWGDLVRTMRVENRIQQWGFTSLHDDVDKIVDDCREGDQENSNFGNVELNKTYSKVTEATHQSFSSSSRSITPDSSPYDESFTFNADFSNFESHDAVPNDRKQGVTSYPIKLAMIQFMRDPNSPNAWAELVDSFREEKMREAVACCEAETYRDIGTKETFDSESGWANFDDVSIKNYQDVLVEHDFKSQQQCAMNAFMQSPSQENWFQLVESIKEEKSLQPETCPTLLRLENKLEKLEEEASHAETESFEDSSLNTGFRRNASRHHWQNNQTSSKGDQLSQIEVHKYDDELHYAV
eukprot:scaffold44608_cov87-Cyclotella_meneghiniana.AAC.6